MNRPYVLILAALLTAGIAFVGCGSKKTQSDSPTTEVVSETPVSPDASPLDWNYDKTPNPPIKGVPDRMLVSFGFDRGASELKSEATGACREAIRRLGDPNAQLVVIGFADAIQEKVEAEKLGLRRAEAVRGFLSTLGIAADRVQVTSFGDAYSTASEHEKIKQARERKVEVWLLR